MRDLIKAVEKHKTFILEAERFLWQHPETGFKEYETSKYMEDNFERLGYDIVRAEGITGFYTVIDTNRPGPEILILAELDSIICPTHPDANPETGAVHSCGHNAQCATLLGIAAALKEDGILDKFCGRIRLCAVPAEELLEIEFREKLREDGVIKYLGGKSEFLSRGYFDGVDIAFMVHTSVEYFGTRGAVGCMAKSIVYKGLAAHAGGCPWFGKNALYAATSGINAANALRETFRESDIIRFHPIITKGGDMVNAIPETVTVESYVRGKTFDGISSANKAINRALVGGAVSLGTNIEIIDTPGYAPLVNDENMLQLASDAAALVIPQYKYRNYSTTGSGSTDMGELSCIMPVVHPYAQGATGNAHGNNYQISDPIAACVDNAKWQLVMLLLLLENGGERAKKIKSEFKGRFSSKEEYFAFLETLSKEGDCIEYKENGEIVVKPL